MNWSLNRVFSSMKAEIASVLRFVRSSFIAMFRLYRLPMSMSGVLGFTDTTVSNRNERDSISEEWRRRSPFM